jgi:hypothetical protein
MKPRQCYACGRWIEPPFRWIFRPVLPEEVLRLWEAEGLPVEHVYCEECIERIKAQQEIEREMVKELEKGEASGTLCAMCGEEMDPPGGYAVPTHDGRRLLRLCATCRDKDEAIRRRGKP